MADPLPRLLTLASQRFGVPLESLGEGDDFFQRLGIDSMQSLDLLSEIEMTFDVEIPDYELVGVKTFRQLADAIAARQL